MSNRTPALTVCSLLVLSVYTSCAAFAEGGEVTLEVTYAIGGKQPVNGQVKNQAIVYTEQHFMFQAQSCAEYARGDPVKPGKTVFILPRAQGLDTHLQIAVREYTGPGSYEGKGKLTSPIPGDGTGVWIGESVFIPTYGQDEPKTQSTVTVKADGSGSWEFRNLFLSKSHAPAQYTDGKVSWTCSDS